jgi:hypothetical protein
VETFPLPASGIVFANFQVTELVGVEDVGKAAASHRSPKGLLTW